jgi:hypothetical protein
VPQKTKNVIIEMIRSVRAELKWAEKQSVQFWNTMCTKTELPAKLLAKSCRLIEMASSVFEQEQQ